jgi:type I restriction enzyme S subunit
LNEATKKIDLSSEQLEIVNNILRTHVSSCAVWVFGSRISGKAKPASDLDLAIDCEKPIDSKVLGLMADVFSESNLPIKVDLVDLNRVDESFRKIIEEQRVLLQAGRNPL